MHINLVKFAEIHSSRLIHSAINLFVLHGYLLQLHSAQPQQYKVSDTKMPLPAYMLNGRD